MNIPGAVERRDRISVFLCVLEKLDNIVSGDNTDGNIALIDHFGLVVVIRGGGGREDSRCVRLDLPQDF
jgi:hypothetical protein